MSTSIGLSHMCVKLEREGWVRLLMFVLISVIPMTMDAQNMSIASFRMDEFDQTANVDPTIVRDHDGEKCALIKIVTNQMDFSFDVGSLGVVRTELQNEQHPGEIWVYVPHGVMKISIQHPRFTPIRDYDLGQRLKKGRTYVLKLTTDQVNTLVVDYDNEQTLEVDVYPPDATLFINGIKQETDKDGKLSIRLSFGTHSYRVVADNYHTENSQVVINDKFNKQTLSVRLKQAFGYLNVDAAKDKDSEGGKVIVDDNEIGIIPVAQYPLKSGKHQLTVNKKLYLPYSEDIQMSDSATITVFPSLIPNYSECSILIEGDKEAQIFDNGMMLGTGHWKGRLEAGEHTLEARKANHNSTSKIINVVKNIPVNVNLTRPQPIYGTLEVVTSPPKAKVYIDGSSKEAGITPYVNTNLLIGTHKVKVMLDGYKTEDFAAVIKEGQTERKTITLTDYCNAVIRSVPDANVYIDGKLEGTTPLTVNKTAGDYKVTLAASGYSPYSKTMRLDGNTKDIPLIRLHQNHVKPNEFYFQAGVSVFGLNGVTVGLGGSIKNINIEGNGMFGLTKSEKIYWNYLSGESIPFVATYTPFGGNVKMGYGVRLNNRIRLTPQAGCHFVCLKENPVDEFASIGSSYHSSMAIGAKTTSLSIGLRGNIAVTSWFGVSLTPEYRIGISKTNGFKALSEVSSTIKGYSDGFNCNVNLNVFF